jgi:hypothetical protein
MRPICTRRRTNTIAPLGTYTKWDGSTSNESTPHGMVLLQTNQWLSFYQPSAFVLRARVHSSCTCGKCCCDWAALHHRRCCLHVNSTSTVVLMRCGVRSPRAPAAATQRTSSSCVASMLRPASTAPSAAARSSSLPPPRPVATQRLVGTADPAPGTAHGTRRPAGRPAYGTRRPAGRRAAAAAAAAAAPAAPAAPAHRYSPLVHPPCRPCRSARDRSAPVSAPETGSGAVAGSPRGTSGETLSRAGGLAARHTPCSARTSALVVGTGVERR